MAINHPVTVPAILEEAANTYRDRTKVYGDNFLMIGPMVKILFPNGVSHEVLTSHAWHLFELKLVKLSRFAVSNLTHLDSIHDDMVYSAMIEMLLRKDRHE